MIIRFTEFKPGDKIVLKQPTGELPLPWIRTVSAFYPPAQTNDTNFGGVLQIEGQKCSVDAINYRLATDQELL